MRSVFRTAARGFMVLALVLPSHLLAQGATGSTSAGGKANEVSATQPTGKTPQGARDGVSRRGTDTAVAARTTQLQRVDGRAAEAADRGARRKPRPSNTTSVAHPIDAKHPLAQAPSFELKTDGTSVVSLSLSHSTDFTAVASRGRSAGRVVEFALKGVQVGVRNNTNPLITEHFATPLSRVQLRRGRAGAHLLLHLREAVQVTPSMKTGPGGTAIFEVTLPKPSGPYAAPKRKVPSGNEGESTQEPKASGAEGESSAEHSR